MCQGSSNKTELFFPPMRLLLEAERESRLEAKGLLIVEGIARLEQWTKRHTAYLTGLQESHDCAVFSCQMHSEGILDTMV